jgi:branched-subunit amino acid ABC-type transport system permease component
MTRFLSLLIAGITFGAVYALVSLGVVVIYRVSRVVNLAHGAMGVFAAYVFHYELVGRLGLPVTVASVLTLLVGAALGVVVQRGLIAPVHQDGAVTTLVMTIGVLLVLTELPLQLWDPQPVVIDSVFSDRTIEFLSTGATIHQIGTVVIVLLLGVGLEWLLTRTRYGKAIECIAQDPGGARIIGLPVTAITTATWALGGATAALAGLLYIHLNSLDSFSLTFVLISSLVAAVLGGFNHLGLAVLGSLGLGVAFSFGQGYVDTAGVPDAVVFVALLAILVLVPGRQESLEVRAEF